VLAFLGAECKSRRMEGSVRWAFASAAVGCLVAVLGACSATQEPAFRTRATKKAQPTPTPTPTATVGIDGPRDGSTTHKRFAVVNFSVQGVPKGASKSVRVQANDWLSRWAGDRGTVAWPPPAFPSSRTVPLTLGRNRIEARLTVERIDNDTLEITPISKSRASITVTRLRADDYGHLDRATALMVADSGGAMYWLCGEDGDCGTQTWCFTVDARRVDCPVGVFEYPSNVRQCAFVRTVHLRHRRIYSGRYACYGRINPNPRRHVRPDIHVQGLRFHAGHRYATERTELGLPRFDYRRDLFIP